MKSFNARLIVSLFVVSLAVASFALTGGEVQAAADTVDEVHYSYGEMPDSVVFNWHGDEANIYYGLDNTYGSQSTASAPAITPANDAGPLKEIKLNGLQPDTKYHYKIGVDGIDHVFGTVPTGDFNWVDVGDTMSTYCGSWMVAENQLMAAQQPQFITHGGDIAVPNQCGLPSIHSFYNDIQAWSYGAAFQPVWGDHESEAPMPGAPSNAITDTLSNYKGRSYVTNGQTVPVDTPSRTTSPGCGSESGSTVNLCQGEDWGWFVASHVMFISYPEYWTNSVTDWQAKADALMASAQSNPNIDFVVTYGHRPPYTTTGAGPSLRVRDAETALALKYSPTSTNPNGKYILNVGHHGHSMEAYKPINGLTTIVDAAGGQGLMNFTTTDPNSIFRIMHFGLLSAKYSAANHSLSISLLCGPVGGYIKDTCTYGTTLYQQTFVSPNTPPPSPPAAVLTTTLSDGVTKAASGTQLTYMVTASNKIGTSTAANTVMSADVPTNTQFVSADDGVVPAYGIVSWDLGAVAGGQTVTKRFTVQVGSVAPGDHVVSTSRLTTSDSACTNTGSVCQATDDDTVPQPPSATTEYITNPSFEANLTGWTGLYNATSKALRVTTDHYDGLYGVKVSNTATTTTIAGINSKPKPVSPTTANTTYTGSIWVKGMTAGQSIVYTLKETRMDGTLVGSSSGTQTTNGTSWQQISASYKAVGSGNEIAVNIYGTNMPSNTWFVVDSASLTAPQ